MLFDPNLEALIIHFSRYFCFLIFKNIDLNSKNIERYSLTIGYLEKTILRNYYHINNMCK